MDVGKKLEIKILKELESITPECVFSCGGGFQPPSPRSIALGKRVKEWVKRVNFFCRNILQKHFLTLLLEENT